MELALEKSNLSSPQEIIEACRNFVTDVTLLDHYSADINTATDLIRDLERGIIKVASNRSRQETDA